MKEVAVLITISFAIVATQSSLQDDIEVQLNNGTTGGKYLSRKRRYLVFPEGSSLQLVYCLTIPSIGMGNIFTVGSTAALAWELPHDPFVDFKRPAEVLHRIDTPNKEKKGGWDVQKNRNSYSGPWSNSWNWNQGLDNNYRRYQAVQYFNNGGRNKNANSRVNPSYPGDNRIDQRGAMMSYAQSQPTVTTYLNPVYHQVYRRTRRDLYSKLEKLFTGLSMDGRACLLKSVCEVSKATSQKGTFMEEILKAIFRVRHQDDGTEEMDNYDQAFNREHNCTEMYPSCENSIWNEMFSFL